MIGRGVLGNPWLIKDIVEYLEKGTIPIKPTAIERIDMCLKHLKYLREIKDEKVAVLEIRNHVAWYLKGLMGSNDIKNKVYATKSLIDIINILENYRIEFMEEN
jgi:tRNA-dihydrouridine synthase